MKNANLISQSSLHEYLRIGHFVWYRIPLVPEAAGMKSKEYSSSRSSRKLTRSIHGRKRHDRALISTFEFIVAAATTDMLIGVENKSIIDA